MVLGKLSVPEGVLLIWKVVEQGSVALAVAVGGICSDIFSHVSFIFSSLLSGRRHDLD